VVVVVVGERAMVGGIKEEVLLRYCAMLHLQDVERVCRSGNRIDKTVRGAAMLNGA
jgi:hypothetical protein